MNQLQHNFNAKTYCRFKLPGKCYVSLNFILWKKNTICWLKLRSWKSLNTLLILLISVYVLKLNWVVTSLKNCSLLFLLKTVVQTRCCMISSLQNHLPATWFISNIRKTEKKVFSFFLMTANFSITDNHFLF